MISYLAASGRQRITFTDDVLDHFSVHRQTGCFTSEAGGQLFATFGEDQITLRHATGPSWLDRRQRFRFFPNWWAARSDIRRMHRARFHYVGDWHTHPEPVPTPSHMDRESMHDIFQKSRHDLAGFLMVIVGTDPVPDGLYVGIYTADTAVQLSSERPAGR